MSTASVAQVNTAQVTVSKECLGDIYDELDQAQLVGFRKALMYLEDDESAAEHLELFVMLNTTLQRQIENMGKAIDRLEQVKLGKVAA
jgi:hypothetical protein